jgi:hypothetical protein
VTSPLTQHWRSLFDNKYLGAWNLWSATKKQYVTATVVIDRIVQESVTMQGGRKTVETLIYFRDKRTPLIATKKMVRVLGMMFGPTPAEAMGHTITLYVERGFMTGQGPADVLRIRNDKAGDSLKRELRNGAPPEDDAPLQAPEEFGSDDPDKGP